jgi:hypothetical protein
MPTQQTDPVAALNEAAQALIERNKTLEARCEALEGEKAPLERELTKAREDKTTLERQIAKLQGLLIAADEAMARYAALRQAYRPLCGEPVKPFLPMSAEVATATPSAAPTPGPDQEVQPPRARAFIRVSPEAAAQWAAMWDGGQTLADISEATGVAQAIIRAHLKRAGRDLRAPRAKGEEAEEAEEAAGAADGDA